MLHKDNSTFWKLLVRSRATYPVTGTRLCQCWGQGVTLEGLMEEGHDGPEGPCMWVSLQQDTGLTSAARQSFMLPAGRTRDSTDVRRGWGG